MHFPIYLNHCVNTTTHIEHTEIVSFILRLSPSGVKGGFIPRDESIEVIRDLRGMAFCLEDNGSLTWALLVSARLVTGRDLSRCRTKNGYDCFS